MSPRQGRRAITDLLERHGLRPRKRLGQHFLADPNIVRRIVEHAGVNAASKVVEVGAGTGALTRELAATGARIVAIEVDTSLKPVLDEVLTGYTNVEVVFGDASDPFIYESLEDGGWVMVANLPYNVGTPIVLDLLRHSTTIDRFVVMVQAEVAQRLAARPGSRTYGLPSVIVGLHGTLKTTMRVAPTVFVPPPEVDSTVITIERHQAPEMAEAAIELAGVAFRQRRKMLRRSLADCLDDPEAVLLAAGVDPTARPETITPEQFLGLALAAASRT